MRELFVLESKAKVNHKPYLIQTLELCVPLPITKESMKKRPVFSGRYFRYECLAVPCSDSWHPMFSKSRLIERHETKEDAICQHKRVLASVKLGARIFGSDKSDD